MILERHDLLYLSREGRERILAEFQARGDDAPVSGEKRGKQELGKLREMLLPEESGYAAIPGIVRREEIAPREGFIPVGFAHWQSGDAGRFRVPSFARPDEVCAKVTPEDVALKLAGSGKEGIRTPALKALAALQENWSFPLSLGVWGSAGMEIETGRPYTHQGSDLDVRIIPQERIGKEILQKCLEYLLEKEKFFDIRVDAELRLADTYGISLKELLSGSATVLGKGREDVVLIQKTDVFEGLAGYAA